MIAVSWAERTDLTYGSDQEMEMCWGGCSPKTTIASQARIPTPVLSYDYWTRRFGRDPKVIARTFHIGPHVYQMVVVEPAGAGVSEMRQGYRRVRNVRL